MAVIYACALRACLWIAGSIYDEKITAETVIPPFKSQMKGESFSEFSLPMV
jgi:hypothetical protein